jgi:hypothetical protein
MIMDIPHYLLDPPAIVEPLVEVSSRRKRARREARRERAEQRRNSRFPAWLFVGAVIILGDDGQEWECQVVHVDEATGIFYCAGDPQPYNLR